MNRRTSIYLVAGAIAASTAACGGRTQNEGLIDAVPNTSECVHSGIDGVTCYPTADIGREPRAGQTYGDRIENLKFVGFRATTTTAPVDTTLGTTVVQMADYFDPTGEIVSLIVLNACTEWCGPCNQVADAFAQGIVADAAPKGVVFLQAITQGLNYAPSTIADIVGFAQMHHANFTLLADPGERVLGSYDIKQAIPFFVVIDPRSMEIVDAWTGIPNKFTDGFVDAMLEKTRRLPPKP